MIDFQWGALLLLLAMVPLLIAIYAWAIRRRRPAAARYSSLSLIHAARPGRARWRRHVPFALFVAAIAALVLAMARPTAVVAVPTTDRTIVLALDVSRSMCASDIEPSRLEAAQRAAIDFVSQQAAGTRIGLVAFSGFAAVIQAPTVDRGVVIEGIASLTTGRRTAVGSGILSAIDAIAEINPNVERSHGQRATGHRAAAGRGRRLRARRHRPADRRGDERGHRAGGRGGTGADSRVARLHDRVRDRAGRHLRPVMRAAVRRAASPAAPGPIRSGAVASAVDGSGAGSTRRR